MARRALLWALPLSVTEASLPEGSMLARRIPDALARLLAACYSFDARWAPLVIEVEEGLGYAVEVASADETEPRERLVDLGGGDYLLYGQLDATPERLWIDLRLFSAAHDEILLYPNFDGPHPELLRFLPQLAAEIALATRGRDCGLRIADCGLSDRSESSEYPQSSLRIPHSADLLTPSWAAFERYCCALDELSGDETDPEEKRRAFTHLLAALKTDPEFALAAHLGLEVTRASLGQESVEHCLDLADSLAAQCPRLPEIPRLRAYLLTELGRDEEAAQEAQRARRLARRPPVE
jgi:hypothetical protein